VEYAIRIINSETGQLIAQDLVTIEEMLSLGKAVARSYEYRCPDPHCARAVRPIFPERQRIDGKEAHSPHFRAPTSHIDGCEKDGAVKRQFERQSSLGTKDSPIFDLVQQTDFPVRFNEVKRIEQPAGDRDIVSVDDSGSPNTIPSDTTNENVKWNHQTHISERTSGHLKKFVQAYENSPGHLLRMPIRIRGCPARNYAETFMDVSLAVDSQGRSALRHIYRGTYREHTVHPRGITIIFNERAGDGKKLGVWVASDLGPAIIRQEFIHRLNQAALNSNATIYVVGRFQLWKRYKYTIEVEALGEVYVSFLSSQYDNTQ